MANVPHPDDPAPGDWDYRRCGPIDFLTFREELLALYEPPMRAKKTRGKMASTLEVVAGLIGPGGTTADFCPTLVARLIASRPAGESPFTTRSILDVFRTACSYAKSRGYLRTSPFEFRRHWIRVGPAAGRRHHSREEIRRVLDRLASEVRETAGWPRWRARRLQAVAATVAYTGLRRDEALSLHAGDVDLGARMLAVVARAGSRLKTERSGQPVPIPAALAPILADWMGHRMDEPEGGSPSPPGCPYLFPNVTRTNAWREGPPGHKPVERLRAAGERAGVAGLSFRSLRHSWATHAESAWGLSPLQIQRVLRHTSQATQEHYRHADEANLGAAVEGIDFGPAGGPTP